MATYTRGNSANSDGDDNGAIPPKPSRPFTAYHIFFQLERNFILQTSDKTSHIDTTDEFKDDVDPHGNTRPPKYRSLVLPKDWHTKGSRPKLRSLRKNHGKITFVEMSKLISQRWREADEATRSYCRGLAERELKRYREEMKDYVEQYGEETLRVAKVKVTKTKKKPNVGAKPPQKRGRGSSETVSKSTENYGVNTKPFLENNQASPVATTISAPQAQASQVPASLTHQYPNLFGGIRSYPDPDQQSLQELNQQQAFLDYQSGLLKMRKSQLELQSRQIELMKMQHQVQAQVKSTGMSLGHQQDTMMPQMYNNVEPQDLGFSTTSFYNFDSGTNDRTRMMTMTTVKDQGDLPPLFEDREYHDFLPTTATRNHDGYGYDNRMDYNNNTLMYPPQGNHPQDRPGCLTTQGPPQKGKFQDIFKSGSLFNAPFDDCSIVGPMGINPSSPSNSPSPPTLMEGELKLNEAQIASPPPLTPGHSRAKSISPMPEYNIAPEISFLAKNFVNEFSKYLNQEHEVQMGDELEAFDNAQATLDHQNVEKQMLNNQVLDNSTMQDSIQYGDHHQGVKGGMKESKESTHTTRGNDSSTLGNMQYCMPLKNAKAPSMNRDPLYLPKSDLSKPRNNITMMGPSTSAGAYCEFSKPQKTINNQQTCVAYPQHPSAMGWSSHAQKTKASTETMSRNSSRDDFQAWFNDVFT